MYKVKDWKDHVTEFPNRRTLVENEDGTVDVTKAQGELIQQGTPQSATNFNNMETGIFAAQATATEAARMAKLNAAGLEAEKGEAIGVSLTNGLAYPFNNSQKTISLGTKKTKTDYYVDVEIISATGGGVGEFRITDKLLNGFKIAYSGAATAANVVCRVKGGV